MSSARPSLDVMVAERVARTKALVGEMETLVFSFLETIAMIGRAGDKDRGQHALLQAIFHKEAEIHSHFAELDTQIRIQNGIDALERRVESRKTTLRQLGEQLMVVHRAVEASLEMASPLRGAGDGVEVDELLSFAHRVAYTTSAPSGWAGGQLAGAYKAHAPHPGVLLAGRVLQPLPEHLQTQLQAAIDKDPHRTPAPIGAAAIEQQQAAAAAATTAAAVDPSASIVDSLIAQPQKMSLSLSSFPKPSAALKRKRDSSDDDDDDDDDVSVDLDSLGSDSDDREAAGEGAPGANGDNNADDDDDDDDSSELDLDLDLDLFSDSEDDKEVKKSRPL